MNTFASKLLTVLTMSPYGLPTIVKISQQSLRQQVKKIIISQMKILNGELTHKTQHHSKFNQKR